MHTTAALITALTGATLALANPAPAPQPAITPVPRLLPVGRMLSPRQLSSTTLLANDDTSGGGRNLNDGDDTDQDRSCTNDYISLIDSQPTPPPEVASYLISEGGGVVIPDITDMDQSFLTELCGQVTRTPPGSIMSAAEDFASSQRDWMSSKKDDFEDVQSSCPGEVSGLVAMMTATDFDSCSSAVQGMIDYADGTTRAPSPTRTGGDGDDDDAGAVATTTESTGGAALPRETGFVAAAAAVVVGVAGVVAAL